MPQGEPVRSYIAPILRTPALNRFLEFLKPSRDGTPPPILSVTGSGGIGKTTFLRQLMKELDQRTFRAYVDCSTFGEDEIPDLLRVVKFFLTLKCAPVGSLWFGRLETGLTVLDSNVELSGPHKKVLRDLSDAVENAGARPGEVDRIVTAGTSDLLGHILTLSFGIPTPMLAPEIGQRLAGWLTGRLGNAGGVKTAIEWFGHRGVNRGNEPIEVLAELKQWHQTGQYQQRDELLIEAFFADIRDAYRPKALKTAEPYRSVLLLDNADYDIGATFLDLVREHRESLLRRRRLDAGPLLIVTAGRSEVPGIPIQPVALPYFDVGEVDDLAKAVPWQTDRRFGKLVHHFGDGYPAVSVALINFHCRYNVDVSGGLGELLDSTNTATGAEITTVEQQLFASLEEAFTHHPDTPRLPTGTLPALATCAASRTLDGALELVREFHDDALVTVDVLAATGLWDEPSPAGGSSLLRWFLLRRLARRGPGPSDWDAVFKVLRDGTVEHAVADRLYYALAMNDVAAVTVDLATRLGDTGMERSWMELVRDVSGAPCAADVSSPYDTQVALIRQVDASKPHHVEIARVVAGLWIANHRCTGPEREDLHDQIADDLLRLAPQADRPQELRAEARRQRSLKRHWK